jgi:hypothetical protein
MHLVLTHNWVCYYSAVYCLLRKPQKTIHFVQLYPFVRDGVWFPFEKRPHLEGTTLPHTHPRSSANDCGIYPPEHGIKTNEAKKTPLTSIHTTNARWTIVVKPPCSILFDEGSSSSPRILGIYYSRGGTNFYYIHKEDYCCSNLGFFSVGLTREIDFGRDLL